MKNFKILAAMFAAGLAFSVASINAQTLTLGGTVEGSLVSQELNGEVPYPGDDGAISTWVVQDSALDSQGYIFIYQVTNSGPDAIGDVELSGFASNDIVSTATYSAETGLTLTGAETPSADGNFTGFSLIGSAATFEDGDLPNDDPDNISYFLVIDTDVNGMTSTFGQEQDSFSAYGSIEAPYETVPEPTSLTLLAGFVCLFGLFKYRRAVTIKPENIS